TVEAAHRLPPPLVLTVEDQNRRDPWGPAAPGLLFAPFLAAASSGRSLRECSRWLSDAGSPIPAELLDTAGFHALAWSLRGAQHVAPETRDGIYQTARTAAKCLNDEDILAWVTPPGDQGLPAFDPAAFAASRDALYLLTESRSAASPLIAALTDAVMRAGRRQAERAGRQVDAAEGAGGPNELAAGSIRRWSWSWMRPPTSAASRICRSCIPTSGRAAWSRSRS